MSVGVEPPVKVLWEGEVGRGGKEGEAGSSKQPGKLSRESLVGLQLCGVTYVVTNATTKATVTIRVNGSVSQSVEWIVIGVAGNND